MSDTNNNRPSGNNPKRLGQSARSKKRFNKKKLWLYIGIPITILLTAGIAYGINLYQTAQDTADQSYEDIDRDKGTSDLRAETVDPVDDNISILLLGIDEGDQRSEEYDYFRTDSMMLATFNKDQGTVKLLSIPRDSYTYIPEVERYTKINHAHSYGGPKAAVDAAEDFVHVPVDYYARVNFNAFIDTVDELGGIYFDVPYDMTESDEDDNKGAITLEEGYQKLDGKQALAVARTRKYDNDVARAERQRKMLKTIADKVTSFSSITKIDDVMTAVGDNLTTNLTFDNMKSFLAFGLQNDFSIESKEMDGWGGILENGGWYYVVDDETRMEVSNELRDHLDLPETDISPFLEHNDVPHMTIPSSNIENKRPLEDQQEPHPDRQNPEGNSEQEQPSQEPEGQNQPSQNPEQNQSPENQDQSQNGDNQNQQNGSNQSGSNRTENDSQNNSSDAEQDQEGGADESEINNQNDSPNNEQNQDENSNEPGIDNQNDPPDEEDNASNNPDSQAENRSSDEGQDK